MDKFIDVIYRTLEHSDKPLTPTEIWEYSESWGTRGDFVTTGRTPDASIGAQLYTSLKSEGTESPFAKCGSRPTRFWLRSKGEWGLENALQFPEDSNEEIEPEVIDAPDPEIPENGPTQKKTIAERDLHEYLSAFVESHGHFNAKTKTIFHEESKRRRSGELKWMHPDMVGVRFPFSDFEEITMKTQAMAHNSSLRFYAFELKLELTHSKLREYYFQAVSNSSWAHEGYLVAAKIKDRQEVVDRCRRLTNAFGIGLIELDLAHIHESQILLPSRSNPSIDWDMVNEIAGVNPGFRDFLASVNTDMMVGRITNKKDYDAPLEQV